MLVGVENRSADHLVGRNPYQQDRISGSADQHRRSFASLFGSSPFVSVTRISENAD